MRKQSEIKVRYEDENNRIELGRYMEGRNRALKLVVDEGVDEGITMITVSENIQDPNLKDNEIGVCLEDNKIQLIQRLLDENIIIDTGKRCEVESKKHAICTLNFKINE